MGRIESGKSLVDARDLDLKMRLGISFFDEPPTLYLLSKAIIQFACELTRNL